MIETWWLPSASLIGSWKRQVPSASATARPNERPSTDTRTVAPGAAVPMRAGCSVGTRNEPSVGANSGCGSVPVRVGALRLVETTNGTGALRSLMPPVGRTARVVISCVPAAIGAAGVKAKAPSAVATALPMALPSTKTVTNAPGAAWPVMVGCPSGEAETAGPTKGQPSDGAAGVWASTVKE
ncbi:hypothetical protein D3C72_982440 [compost metagenome]